MIADALSIATLEVPDERPRILSICMDPDISDLRLEEILKATEEDSEFQCLITYITQGWPGKRT